MNIKIINELLHERHRDTVKLIDYTCESPNVVVLWVETLKNKVDMDIKPLRVSRVVDNFRIANLISDFSRGGL